MGTTYWFFRCQKCNEFDVKILLTKGDQSMVDEGYISVNSKSIAVVCENIEDYDWQLEGIKCASCDHEIHNDIEEDLEDIKLAF